MAEINARLEGEVDPAKVAEDAVIKVCQPISEALSSWTVDKSAVGWYPPTVEDNLALMFELVMVGANIAANYDARTSVVAIPMAFVDRFKALGIVVPQHLTEKELQEIAEDEVDEGVEGEGGDGSESNELFSTNNRHGVTKKFLRTANFVGRLAGATKESFGHLGTVVVETVATKAVAGFRAITKTEERSRDFYQRGLVPWRDLEGWNYSHATVLRLAVMMFSNRNLPKDGGLAAGLAAGGDWKQVESGDNPMELFKEDIQYAGLNIESMKKDSTFGGKKLTSGSAELLLTQVVNALRGSKL